MGVGGVGIGTIESLAAATSRISVWVPIWWGAGFGGSHTYIFRGGGTAVSEMEAVGMFASRVIKGWNISVE